MRREADAERSWTEHPFSFVSGIRPLFFSARPTGTRAKKFLRTGYVPPIDSGASGTL